MMNFESIQPAAPAIRIFPDGRMDTDGAAAYTGLSKKTLAIMRMNGDGPEFVKLGKTVFYRKEDLDAWIADRRASSTAEYRVKTRRTAA